LSTSKTHNKISQELINKIRKDKLTGLSALKVGKLNGVAKSTVLRYCKDITSQMIKNQLLPETIEQIKNDFIMGKSRRYLMSVYHIGRLKLKGIVANLSPTQREKVIHSGSNHKLHPCPECGKTIRVESKLCMDCYGKNRALTKKISYGKTHPCQDCGKSIRLISQRCYDCRIKYLKSIDGYKTLESLGVKTRFQKGRGQIIPKKPTQPKPVKVSNSDIVKQLNDKNYERNKLLTVKKEAITKPQSNWNTDGNRWKGLPIVVCKKSPTQRHVWELNANNWGICKYCKKEQQHGIIYNDKVKNRL
jgi:hypothetical protein